MILLCCGQISAKHFDALLLLGLQLDKSGHPVAIDDRFLPENVTKQNKYEMAPFLADFADIAPKSVVLIGAETISTEVQTILGTMHLGEDIPIWVLGQFSQHQDAISARNKIAYATGREPKLLDLSSPQRPSLMEGAIAPQFTEIGDSPSQAEGKAVRVLVYIPCEDIKEQDTTLSDLCVVNYSPNIHLQILTNSKGKDLIRRSRHGSLSVFSYAELPPTELLHYFDVLVFLGTNVPGERMAALALDAMGAGKVVIDCTTSSGFSAVGAPVLKGPEHVAALPGYLQETVSQNRMEIGRRTQQSAWLHPFDITGLERELQLERPAALEPASDPHTVFFPTNGNGMGHAQRCALIGEAMQTEHARRFVAFPSCVEMLRNRGFSCVPMVPRSADHSVEYAADLVNYLRLRSTLRPGDQLVFDGGYVFDSVYRLISRLQNPAVWIRRGLWRPGQINPIALERERAFSKVIVPTEAFAELNTDYSSGDHIHKVGPIVQQKEIAPEQSQNLRERLSAQFERKIDTLVVTMLGGGVASERTAQTQFLCSLLERRVNCLHLVVAWPNAVVPSGLYGWHNSRVIHTERTLDLCQAADLTISATGYNSFHELIYAQVPAILIPQSAPYLDDQERRARAAFERGLAGFVQEVELMSLEREVTAFLDNGKSDVVRQALRAVTLPEPGNHAAAKLIEQGSVR
ncbi:glycosyltransferase [uncultured Roseobacter sp.]|uniref:glycosyltransferase n=1 Tax=uncultured Roseobacter sp. TaxID=114847 RepID=UPI002616AEAF|nr:glycosyltransferase [uncultured Roseobacter sp.]